MADSIIDRSEIAVTRMDFIVETVQRELAAQAKVRPLIMDVSEFAVKGKFDLVVTGSRGIGGIKGAILGSVANSIVQKSKVSVLVVK